MSVSTIPPNKVLYIKEPPPPDTIDAFESLFRAQPGFSTVRYSHVSAFAEFTDVESATAALQELNGQKFHTDAPPLRMDYDRDAGQPPRKRSLSSAHYGYPSQMPYFPSHPGTSFEWSDDYRASKRLRHDSFPQPSPHFLGRSSRHFHDQPPYFSESSRSYYDPYHWLDDFLPYWVTTGNVPPDPLGRMKRNAQNLTKSCATLFVRNLPEDITQRELQFLFAFLPNFRKVRLVVKQDQGGVKTPMAFVDFADDASAYVAMCCMQGYYYNDTTQGLHIEYDKNNRYA